MYVIMELAFKGEWIKGQLLNWVWAIKEGI
jgi:hypothetical protein